MNISDLNNFTRTELAEMFVELINNMEVEGKVYANFYNNLDDKIYAITYADGLLAHVNRIKTKVLLKNKQYFEWTYLH